MPRHIHTNQVDYSQTILTQGDGGTGHRTQQEAAVALGLVTQATIDADSSYFRLDSTGNVKIPDLPIKIQTIANTLSGENTVTVGSTNVYRIVDFDKFTEYSISVTLGTVTQNGDLITFVAPNITGDAFLSVNDKKYKINIIPLVILKPTILSPTMGADVDLVTEVTVSDFGTINGYSDSLSELEIVVTSDLAGKVILFSQKSTTNKCTLMFGQWSTTYYLRARYKGAVYGKSELSNVVTVKTKNSIYPKKNGKRLWSPSVVTTSDNYGPLFGQTISVSSDGSTIVASTRNDTAFSGYIDIYANVSDNWQNKQRISLAEFPYSMSFGFPSVVVNADGSKIAIGIRKNGQKTGVILVYEKQPDATYVRNAVLEPNETGFFEFGNMLCINDLGTRIATIYKSDNLSEFCDLRIYDFTAGSWVLVKNKQLDYTSRSLYPNVTNNTMSMSADGKTIMVSMRSDFVDVLTEESNWEIQTVLNEGHDKVCSLSPDGKNIAAWKKNPSFPYSFSFAIYQKDSAEANQWSFVNNAHSSIVNLTGYPRDIYLSNGAIDLYVHQSESSATSKSVSVSFLRKNATGEYFKADELITSLGIPNSLDTNNQPLSLNHVSSSKESMAVSRNQELLIMSGPVTTSNVDGKIGAIDVFNNK